MRPFNYRGPTIPGNVPAFVTARWSPDGRWIAYLRAADGVTRLGASARTAASGTRFRRRMKRSRTLPGPGTASALS
jgi:Tol biopolymer transport system component